MQQVSGSEQWNIFSTNKYTSLFKANHQLRSTFNQSSSHFQLTVCNGRHRGKTVAKYVRWYPNSRSHILGFRLLFMFVWRRQIFDCYGFLLGWWNAQHYPSRIGTGTMDALVSLRLVRCSPLIDKSGGFTSCVRPLVDCYVVSVVVFILLCLLSCSSKVRVFRQ